MSSMAAHRHRQEPRSPATAAGGAVADLRAGWARRELWWALALQDLRGRYRRSVLGPFWITLQMLAFVLGIGVLYAALFKQDWQTFLPYVAVGYLLWLLMIGAVQDATTAFTAQAHYIRSAALPVSVYAYRTVTGLLLTFAHHVVVVAALLAVLRVRPSPLALVLVPAALALVVVNSFFVVLWLGPMSARFRDVAPFVGSLTQLLLFVTPVIWDPLTLPGRAAVVWNPFAYFLEVFRDPILDRPLSVGPWVVVVGLTVVNAAAALVVFGRTRRRVAYWVG